MPSLIFHSCVPRLVGLGIIAVVSCCGAAAQDAAGPLPPPKPAAVAPQGQPLQQAQPPAASAPTQSCHDGDGAPVRAAYCIYTASKRREDRSADRHKIAAHPAQRYHHS